MIERLDQLTLADLIEVSCGNMECLLQGGKPKDDKDVARLANRLFEDYLAIASPKQAKMNLAESEELVKLRMKEKCLRICIALCGQNRHDMAKVVLIDLDVDDDLLTSNEKISLRCRAMLDEVQYEIKRMDELAQEKGNKKLSVDAIRKSWYSEISYVMSTLKMSIDPAATNAAIYANLVRQAGERSKALSKMPIMAGMLF